MSTPAAKRIRLNSSTTVHKPFKSPFKTPRHDKNPLTQNHASANSTSKPLSTPTSYKSCTPSRRAITARHLISSTNTPTSSSTTSFQHDQQLRTDPLIAPLLHAQRALEAQVCEVKAQLDIAEQARNIENASTQRAGEIVIDEDLIGLIEKWKDVSQRACEELFVSVREKVDSMGGPKAWRKSEKEQRAFSSAYNDDRPPVTTDPDDAEFDSGKEDSTIDEYDVEIETDNERQARTENASVDDTPEDEFNMGTMLRMMNVDVDVIGYDWKSQAWKG